MQASVKRVQDISHILLLLLVARIYIFRQRFAIQKEIYIILEKVNNTGATNIPTAQYSNH